MQIRLTFGVVEALYRFMVDRRSKKTPKTGDHGGRVREPERHCLLLTDTGIPHLLEDGYRALRAPASPSVLYADSQAPGAKRGSGSLRLSRWLPQPATRAAACCDDAGGNGGLAHVHKFPRFHPFQDIGADRGQCG